MNQDHDALQVLGTILIAIYSALLLLVRGLTVLKPLWSDALLLAALYSLVAVAVRMAAYLQIVGQLEARILNGLIAAVFLSTLVVLIIGIFLTERAVRKCVS